MAVTPTSVLSNSNTTADIDQELKSPQSILQPWYEDPDPAYPPPNNEENRNDNNTHQRQYRRPSLINMLLLHSTLIGLGCMIGYGIFVQFVQTQCQELIQRVEQQHNVTRRNYQHRYETLQNEQTKCRQMEDSMKFELSELRGRLDGSTVLGKQHKTLLAKYSVSTKRLMDLRTIHEETTEKLRWMEKEVTRKHTEWVQVKQDIESYITERDKLERRLIDQTHLNDIIITKKDEEVKQLQGEKDSCITHQRSLESELKSIKSHLQRRQGVQCQTE